MHDEWWMFGNIHYAQWGFLKGSGQHLHVCDFDYYNVKVRFTFTALCTHSSQVLKNRAISWPPPAEKVIPTLAAATCSLWQDKQQMHFRAMWEVQPNKTRQGINEQDIYWFPQQNAFIPPNFPLFACKETQLERRWSLWRLQLHNRKLTINDWIVNKTKYPPC